MQHFRKRLYLEQMKKICIAFSVSLLFSIACSDSKSNPQDVQKEVGKKEMIIDSVVVKDSLREGTSLDFSQSDLVLVFPKIKNKTLLDSIYFNYPYLKDYSKNGIQQFLKASTSNQFSKMKLENKGNTEYTERYSSERKMKLISIDENFLQLQYFQSVYSGGAHANYSFINRVYDLKNNKKLNLNDITDMSNEKLSALLRKNIDQFPGKASDGKNVIANSEFLLVDQIPVNNNFYFDEKNLYFHYSPYEIAAYAAGDIIIPISWEDLRGTLPPDFKKKLNQ